MDNLFIKYVFTTFRDITTEILSNRPIGAFVVRQSQSRSDALALSVHIPYGMVAHYLIQKLIHNNKLYYKIQVCTYVNCILNRNMKKSTSFIQRIQVIWYTYVNIFFFSQDSKKMFQSLVSLVIHHSVMPECLPCPLILSHSDIGSDDENHVNKQLSTSCQWVSFKIQIRKLHLLLQSSGKSKKLLK